MTDERKLIRDLRAKLADSCICVPVYKLDDDGDYVRIDRTSHFCGYCKLVEMIDKGLAEIEKTKELKREKAWDEDDAARRRRKREAALRVRGLL